MQTITASGVKQIQPAWEFAQDGVARIRASGWPKYELARLGDATSLLEALIANGATLAIEGDQIRYRSTGPKLTDAQREIFTKVRDEIFFLIGRSNVMPRCPKCNGRLIEQFTFDGFANILCPACNRAIGCIPVAPEAIARFGARTVESLPGFVMKEAVSR